MIEKSIYIFDWKPPLNEFKEVVSVMNTHIGGESPDYIFDERRPLESRNESFKQWRKDNFRPFLKEYFDSVIYAVNEFLYSIEYKETNKENYKIGKLSTFQYISNDFFKLSEQDPNALLVVVPTLLKQINPFGKVEEIIVFNDLTKKIELDVLWIDSDRIAYYQNDVLIYHAGIWEHDKYKDNYFVQVSKEKTSVLIPYYDGNKVIYNEFIVYNNLLKTSPAIPVKNNSVKNDKGIYNIPYMWGSAMLGDLIYGQHSDLQVTSTRHVFPIKTMLRNPCTDTTSYTNDSGQHVCNNEPTKVCNTCSGVGYVVQESPFGTIFIDSTAAFDKDKPIMNPVSYVSPDTSPMTFNKDLIDWYVTKLEKTMGFINQNNTNASESSKKIDRKEKETKVKVILDDILKVYVNLNKVIYEYLNPSSENAYTFQLTSEYDIYTIDELREQLNEAIIAKAPLFLKKSIVKKIFYKEAGKNTKSDFILNFLTKYDKFFGMTDEEILTKTATLGSIAPRDVYLHDLGIDILNELLKDKSVDEVYTESEITSITNQFNTIIDGY